MSAPTQYPGYEARPWLQPNEQFVFADAKQGKARTSNVEELIVDPGQEPPLTVREMQSTLGMRLFPSCLLDDLFSSPLRAFIYIGAKPETHVC